MAAAVAKAKPGPAKTVFRDRSLVRINGWGDDFPRPRTKKPRSSPDNIGNRLLPGSILDRTDEAIPCHPRSCNISGNGTDFQFGKRTGNSHSLMPPQRGIHNGKAALCTGEACVIDQLIDHFPPRTNRRKSRRQKSPIRFDYPSILKLKPQHLIAGLDPFNILLIPDDRFILESTTKCVRNIRRNRSSMACLSDNFPPS